MRVLVVDDDKLICLSLKTILEADGDITVAGTGHSGQEAIELYGRLKPDILLMDIRMEGLSGLHAGEEILKADRDAKILYLTTFADDEYIIRALKMGAHGYILKQNYESIVPSLKAVYMGQTVFDEDIVSKLPSFISHRNKPSFSSYGISEREMDIISLVAEGLSNKEIASRLFLSEGTVRNYLSVILEKLDLRDRTQLAIFYYKSL